MKKLFFLFLLIVALAIPRICLGETVYVSGCGDSTSYNPSNDACTGGSDRCYDTIGEALNYISAGDTIDIRGSEAANSTGIYREKPEMLSTTKSWDNVTIKGHTGESVYWQYDNATYAQSGGSRWDVDSGTRYITASADFSGGEMVSLFYEHPSSGSVWRCKRESSSADVDADDEFYHNDSTGYVYLRIADRGLGQDPDSYLIHLSNQGISNILTIASEGTRKIDGVTVEGITFRFTSSLRGIQATDTSGTYDILNLTIKDCNFKHLGISAIQTWGSTGAGSPEDTVIQDCTFDDCGGYDDPTYYGTLSMSNETTGITIKDNTFDNAFRNHISAGDSLYGTIYIDRNAIKGGSNYGGTWHDLSCMGLRLPSDTSFTAYIRNNIIAGMWSSGIHNPAGADAGTIYVYCNTLAYNGQGGGSYGRSIEMCGGSNEIKGNIIWGLDDLGSTKDYRREIHIHNGYPLSAGNQCDYNLIDSDFTNDASADWPVFHHDTSYKVGGGVNDWLDATIGGSSPDQNSIYEKFTTDNNYPDFSDNQTDGSGNYHISSSSPCIEQGLAALTTYDVDEDTRDGSTPDIGADEYVGEAGRRAIIIISELINEKIILMFLFACVAFIAVKRFR